MCAGVYADASKYTCDASDLSVCPRVPVCLGLCEWSIWVLLVVHTGCRLVTLLFAMLQWCVCDVSLEPGH